MDESDALERWSPLKERRKAELAAVSATSLSLGNQVRRYWFNPPIWSPFNSSDETSTASLIICLYLLLPFTLYFLPIETEFELAGQEPSSSLLLLLVLASRLSPLYHTFIFPSLDMASSMAMRRLATGSAVSCSFPYVYIPTTRCRCPRDVWQDSVLMKLII